MAGIAVRLQLEFLVVGGEVVVQTNNRVKPNFSWVVLGCFGVVLGLCCG